MLLEFSVALGSKNLRLQLEGLRIPQEQFSSDSSLIDLKRNFPLWRLCLGRVWVVLLQGCVQRGVFPLVISGDHHSACIKRVSYNNSTCWLSEQTAGQNLGEPARSSHQCPGAWVVWWCWESTAHFWAAGTRTPLAELPFFFFPHLHAFCMSANTITATLLWSLHVCKLRHFLAGYSGRSGHPYLSSNNLSDPWVQGPKHSPWAQSNMENWERKLIESYFHPKLNESSISSSHTIQNNSPGFLRYMAKPLEISWSACSINTVLAESAGRGWFRFCHIFCEFWKYKSQKVSKQVCFQHGRKEHLSNVSPAQPSHSPQSKMCSGAWVRS